VEILKFAPLFCKVEEDFSRGSVKQRIHYRKEKNKKSICDKINVYRVVYLGAIY
jgi:hypothetical protein